MSDKPIKPRNIRRNQMTPSDAMVIAEALQQLADYLRERYGGDDEPKFPGDNQFPLGVI